jgi:hypothetical protein
MSDAPTGSSGVRTSETEAPLCLHGGCPQIPGLLVTGSETPLKQEEPHCVKRATPPEVQRLGRTIRKRFDKICNHHLARVTNGPTESLNNLIPVFG